MKKYQLLLLIFIILLIPFYVLWKNIFPSFEYFSSEANNHGIVIKKKELENGEVLLFNPYYKNYFFNKINLKVELENFKKVDYPIEISIYENYEAVAYPLKGKIENEEDLLSYLYYQNYSNLPNGTIFSNDDSAFLISKGEYRPILGSEIFEKLGFEWGRIIPQESDIFAKLKGEGEKIAYNSAHPDGIFLSIEDRIYLVWDENLIEVSDENILQEAWNEYYVVKTSQLQELDKCVKIPNNTGIIECDFEVSSSKKKLPYIFKVSDGDNNFLPKISKVKSELKVSKKISDLKSAFIMMLSNVKKDFISKYGGYLIFNNND